MGLKNSDPGYTSPIRTTWPYEKLLIRIRQTQKLKDPTEAAVQKINDPDPGSPKLGSLGLRSGTLIGGNVSLKNVELKIGNTVPDKCNMSAGKCKRVLTTGKPS
jgi:hypothetical protein